MNQLLFLQLGLLFGMVTALRRRNVDESSFDPLIFDPCSYPNLVDNFRCGIYGNHFAQGRVCDPYNLLSVFELKLVSGAMNELEKKSEDITTGSQCHFRFGLALLNEIRAYPNRSLSEFGSLYCPQIQFAQHTLRFKRRNENNELNKFAQNYARIIRERGMRTDDCDDGLLILLVKEPFNDETHRPRVFLSYGSLISEYFAYNSQLVLNNIVNETNVELQAGYPRSTAITRLMTNIADAIKERIQMPQPKNHVPFWAHATFAVCFLLMAIMFVILFFLRTNHGRVRSKFHGADPARRWKAGGFVGEDSQPMTYVNLVQMLMPHKQQIPANVQQVV
ncbi:hypothetical protein M3Y98_00607600 [Aphelenchoides besseyi]|nr:hypothetical protein M3Y98_00607600 [Aphelenchoides besseyi]KAI6208253.1 hypothetical protein M3Y96_00095600 [Aphelenchoides besseyi]